jgi:hypothetical protein
MLFCILAVATHRNPPDELLSMLSSVRCPLVVFVDLLGCQTSKNFHAQAPIDEIFPVKQMPLGPG